MPWEIGHSAVAVQCETIACLCEKAANLRNTVIHLLESALMPIGYNNY